MVRILGIDPGLQHSGWGVVDVHGNQLRYVACGVISTKAKDPMANRLLCLSNAVDDIIREHEPQECAIEETFVNKNPASSLKLGHARGALMLACSSNGLVPFEYAANLVKKAIVGKGHAQKEQMMLMIQQLLPGANLTRHDSADALGVAICHANHRNWHQVA